MNEYRDLTSTESSYGVLGTGKEGERGNRVPIIIKKKKKIIITTTTTTTTLTTTTTTKTTTIIITIAIIIGRDISPKKVSTPHLPRSAKMHAQNFKNNMQT